MTANIPASTQSKTIRQTLSNALIITRREVRDSLRDWRIITPILILTFAFPFLAQAVAASFSNFLEGYGADLIGDRTIPFLLMIVGFFPISISLVIALETFVGEKERRSLEPLLSTPLTNTELYIGKTLSAMIPPLMASFGGMTVYLLTLLGGELAWRPEPMLVLQIFLLTIIQALVMVTGAVVVSSQTTSTRAANLLASFIIIPMTLIINGESIIMFLAPDAESPRGIGALWAIIVGMAVAVVLLLRLGNSIFNREELLGRSIDAINFSSTLKRIWGHMIAVDEHGNRAENLLDWYRRAIPYSLRQSRQAIFITIGVFTVYFIIGFVVALQPQWQVTLPPQDSLGEFSTPVLQQNISAQVNESALSFIITQNGRVLLGTLILSMFSFGIAAYVIPPVTFTVLGYLFSIILISGWNPLIFFVGILPHGIVEIPIIVIATAVSFRLGSIITRPPNRQTIGSALTMALGDAIKVSLGVVIPGLIIAALLEVYLTPRLLAMVLGM